MLKAPFPYFGGKSRIAAEVWSRFGDVPNYIEPFFGSGAVLLARDETEWRNGRIETANDINGYVSNFYRAVRSDPDLVAEWADWPANENDLTARHIWLVTRRDSMQVQLEGDPDWFDAKIAGWWVWGMALWIGGGFCSGDGPWSSVVGQLVRDADSEGGVSRGLVHLGDAGRGVQRQLVHLGSAGQGVQRKCVHLGDAGQGVQRKRVHLGDAGDAGDGNQGILEWMRALAERLARVRICCGDWARICGPSPTENLGVTGVFLDPPYSAEANRDLDVYGHADDPVVAHAVRGWAIARGGNPMYRIALCGYEGEHDMPADWKCHGWKAHGGYGNRADGAGRANAGRERIWFSPHCLRPEKQGKLFEK